jgi:hypothetical protein
LKRFGFADDAVRRADYMSFHGKKLSGPRG